MFSPNYGDRPTANKTALLRRVASPLPIQVPQRCLLNRPSLLVAEKIIFNDNRK